MRPEAREPSFSAAKSAREPAGSATLGDPRFRALLSADDWAALPPSVRQRFSKRLVGGETAIYRGEILETATSRAGRCLAQIARLFGGPLPLSQDAGVPAIVTVTEDIATKGQHWTRLYVRRKGFPQVIHSSKRFSGPTGLEEYIGGGIAMALSLEVRDGALIFRNAAYQLCLFGCRLTAPRWLAALALTVTHREWSDGRFVFELRVAHPLFGEMIRQTAVFEETSP
jgi:hypothetical protein